MKRNAYLVNRAMGNFLFASVLTMAIIQLTNTIDGVIVSHLVCPDALSAITLYSPVSLVVSALNALAGIGATILAAKAMGQRDKEAVSGILSTALACVLLVGAVLAVAGFGFSDTVTSWLTSDAHLTPQVKPYLTVMLGLAVIQMLSQFVNQCVSVDGHPVKVTKAVVLVFITNIVLDLVLVGLVGMGIQGSAIATIASFAVSILYLSRHLFSNQSDIKFRIPAFSKWLGGNLSQGVPLMISNLVLTVMLYAINTIVQGRLGHDGMFVMSVCMNILMIGLMLSGGFGGTILSLGGFLYGQQDFMGTRILVKRCLMFIIGITLAFTAFVMLFPSVLTTLFGANTEHLQAIANTGVSIFIVCLTPVCVILMLANLYQMEGHVILTPCVILLLPVGLISLLVLFARSASDSFIWYAFPVGGYVVLLATWLASGIVRIMNRQDRLMPLLLVPQDNKNRLYEASIKNDVNTFNSALSSMPDYMERFDLTPTMRKNLELCIEELLLNTIQHSGISDNGHYTDIRIIQTDDKITFSLKYEGKAFNPAVLSEEKKKFGMKIVSGFCDEIDYKYMYGQNMLYLSWATATSGSESGSSEISKND